MPSDAEKLWVIRVIGAIRGSSTFEFVYYSGLHQVICTFDVEDVMGLLEFLEQTALSTYS